MIDVMLMCLAWNVYFESRGERVQGQYAVAEVTMRRAELSGKSICEEVFEYKQFSWTLNKQPHVTNNKAWASAKRVAHEVYALPNKTDYSKGATHFHTTKVKPKWSKSSKLCHVVTIDNHVFYKPCQ